MPGHKKKHTDSGNKHKKQDFQNHTNTSTCSMNSWNFATPIMTIFGPPKYNLMTLRQIDPI